MAATLSSARHARGDSPKLAPPAEPAPKQAAADDPVIASFTGGAITRSQLQSAIHGKVGPMRARIATQDGRKAFLRELVDFELLVREAERRGYAKHHAVVQKTRETAVQSLVAAERESAAQTVTDEEIAARYAAEPDRWKRPALRRARHVQLATEQEAEQLLGELRASEAKQKGSALREIERIARERSTDAATARQAGELGHFDSEGKRRAGAPAIDPALARAAFALRGEGELAGPVRTATGFSVLALVSETPAIDKPLKKVAQVLREELAAGHQQRHVDALIERLRAQTQVETHPEHLASIALDPDPARGNPRGFAAAPRDPSAASRVVEPDGF